MKVTLINPRMIYLPSQPPLGLGYIAAYLQRAGHEVQFIEAAFVEDDEAVARLAKEFGAQLIGVTVMISYFRKSIDLATILKRHMPNVPITFGGPHPSVVPDDFLAHDAVDYVMVGEGEVAFTQMATDLEMGEFVREEIPGLHWRGGKFVPKACGSGGGGKAKTQALKFVSDTSALGTEHRAPRIEDLDTLPWPARHLMPMDLYKHRGYNVSYGFHGSNFNIMTTRGCPFACNFCDHSVFGRRTTVRDVNDCIDEIEHVSKTYGIRNFDVMDDTFTMNAKFVMAFCDELIRRDLGLFWACRMRVTKVTREVIKRMAEAGCVRFSLGIESIDPGVLKSIEKNIAIEHVIQLLKWAKEFGLLTIGNFMIGNIGDTRESVYKTLQFSLETKEIDIPSWVVLVPLPNTEVFDIGKEKGWIRSFDWDDYRMNNKDLPVWRNEALSYEDLREIYADVAAQVRPKIQYAMDVYHQERLQYYPELMARDDVEEVRFGESKLSDMYKSVSM